MAARVSVSASEAVTSASFASTRQFMDILHSVRSNIRRTTPLPEHSGTLDSGYDGGKSWH